jgi:hypothetical protein
MRWNHLPLTMNLDGVSTPKVDDELSVLGFGDVDKDVRFYHHPHSLQHVTVNAVDFKYCWTLF